MALWSSGSNLVTSGGSIVATQQNPIGINPVLGSAELFPIFKNRIRESRGFNDAATGNTPVALSAAGWPTTDWGTYLVEGVGNGAPSWLVGSFACGFITTTGTETISAPGGNSIANIVRGAVGTYTTFDLVATGVNVFLSITGTSGTMTNVFAFLPAYRAMAPAAGTSGAIDDPTTANAFTNEAVAHFQQYAHIRPMGIFNAPYNVQVSTSATRHTPANVQALGNWAQGGLGGLSFTGTPNSGDTSATLSANWKLPSGSYCLPIVSTNNLDARICALTNGATTCTWANSLTENATSANLGESVGTEGFPIEWMVGLCNACGNLGLWINTPLVEDGTNSSAGSWSSAVMDYLNAHWISTGKIYFECGNENWNFIYAGVRVMNGLAKVNGFATPDLFGSVYVAYRLHAFANLCRTKFPTKFGSQVNHVFAWQTVGLSNAAAIWTQLALLGTPSADVQFFSIAPYVTPMIGNGDSIAMIESETNTAGVVQALNSLSENQAILALSYGVSMGSYESGGQWNLVNQNNANVGLAIMDGGMTASVRNYYQAVLNSGFSFITHTNSGVTGSNSNTSPTLELSNVYGSPLVSPTLTALQSFMAGNIPNRNIVSESGSVVSGTNYADNSSALVNAPGNFNLGANIAPHLLNGYCPYLINCLKAGTYALSVNFTVTSGSPTTSVEVNGTVLSTGNAVTTGNVSLGNVTFTKGVNYVLLGQSGTQAGVSVNSLTFT